MLALAGCGGSDGAGSSEDTGEAGSGNKAGQTADLAQVEKETASKLIQALSEEEVGPGTEWSIIGIARSSMAKEAEAQNLFTQYQENLRIAVKRGEGVLDPDRPTDNARAAIVLQILGEDPADVEGYDLLAQLEDKKAVKAQGINAEIWALNAAACCGRELEAEKDYIQDICDMQADDGGISFDGKNSDVDISAMAIQALAPFSEKDVKLADIASEARSWLSVQQTKNGDYGNSESTSQVILAVTAMGDDPEKAEDMIKDGGNLIDGQMMYRTPDGFCHVQGDETDMMATEQALCAIDSILLLRQGETLF